MAVSMKTGTIPGNQIGDRHAFRLNGVRSWRPEQSTGTNFEPMAMGVVSMKSGLGGRNNVKTHAAKETLSLSLNGVRSRRPEQFRQGPLGENLRLVVSMKSGLGDRNNQVLTVGIGPAGAGSQ